MNKNRQVNKYLLEYLKKTIPNFQKKGKMFTCPQKHLHPEGTEELTANEFPEGSGKCFCFTPGCGNVGNFIDLYRKFSLDNNADIENSDIIDLIIEEFGIKINEEQEKLFDLYEKLGFDMVPVNKNGKEAFIEKDWQNRSHRDRAEWEEWVKTVNLGVKTGKLSNILILDFDFVSSDLKKRIYEGKPTEKMLEDAKKQWEEGLQKIKEKIRSLDFTTLQQRTFGGLHLIYIYDSEIPKTSFNFEGIHIDIEAEAGQCVIEPSLVGGQNRQIVGDKINPLPKELKDFILQNCQKVTVSDKKDVILPDAELTFENLNGNRNNTMISLYGKLRKTMPIKTASYTLNLFNGLLDKKVPEKELRLMAKEAEKYHTIDIEAVGDKIIEHFKLVNQEVHLRDLKEVLNIERVDIEQALRFLLDKGKIYKVKRDMYKLITDVEWRTDFMSVSQPLAYKIPYFDDYARFNNGSMIIIGGKTGTGKSHVVVNMIEHFVKQGICPKLITTEADSGMGEIALARGLKEGDFKFWQTSDPLSVPFKENEVRIVDWISARGDFTKLGHIYEQFNDKLVNFGGLLICLSQLRKDNGNFPADSQIDQYASLATKFLYPEKNGQIDNLHPYFETIKTRRPKLRTQYFQIPLEYIPETKELRIKK